MGKNNNWLVFDIETDSVNVADANMKWFGAYSTLTNEYYLLDYTQTEEIKNLLENHHYLIGFNNKKFDQPILEKLDICWVIDERSGETISIFKYKIITDLYEVCSPTGKNRLTQMGITPKNFSLKEIIKTLKLDEENKGDIDYNIFKKDNWTQEERVEIKKYLKQDVQITEKLMLWFLGELKPLSEMLNWDSKRKLAHIRSSCASLAYQIICNGCNIPCEFDRHESDEKPEKITFEGGHHIEARWKKAKGNIVSIDFASAYPHAIMMGNLFSSTPGGWVGGIDYDLKGSYNTTEPGKIETLIEKIYRMRLDAKQSGDKKKNIAYKLIINSIYGILGKEVFKNLYNPIAAGDCTYLVRTWLKKLAYLLEEEGYRVLYGFTDNVYVLIPEESSVEELMIVVDSYLDDIKQSVPFPKDTFKMEIEKELKFMYFIKKNCYLWVDKNGVVDSKDTLLNKKTPDIIMNVFDNYMKPKISNELDVNFTRQELKDEILKILEKDITLSASKHSVKESKSYKSKTSIQFQIAEQYGAGDHLLIPNKCGVGVGKQKSIKGRTGVRFCSVEDFKQNNLTINDIDVSNLLDYLNRLIVENDKSIQIELPGASK